MLSHSDSDHVAAVPQICAHYHIKTVVREGYKRVTQVWKDADAAIHDEVEHDGCTEINLQNATVTPGKQFALGEVSATFIAGYGKIPTDWPQLSTSEDINARSVVFRLVIGDKSIIFCGDTVGRHIGDPDDVCIAAEADMVRHNDIVPLRSDVMVAPHHGSDNGSSSAFIQAVHPQYVIFSAGHKFQHPRQTTADRYLQNGISLAQIFRTDRGDNEGGEEWMPGPPGPPDPKGDDDVEVLLTAGGAVHVNYRIPETFAPTPAIAAASVSPGAIAHAAMPIEPTPIPVTVSSEPRVVSVSASGAGRDGVGLGDEVTVKIQGLNAWLKKANHPASGPNRTQPIVLFLKDRPLTKLYPYPLTDPSREELKFQLKRTAESKEAWNSVLGEPGWNPRQVPVSVGFEDQWAIPSDVGSFSLAVVPHGFAWFYLCIIALLAAAFIYLTARSNLLRDSGPEPTNSARKAFSLARTQMAWWFFIVLTSYLFLGLVTQDFSTTINGTALALCGISAGAFVGAAVIDGSKIATPGALPAAATKPTEHWWLDVLSDADGVSFYRFQLVAWTFILGVVFLVHVYRYLEMPSFDEYLLALLGISAGTYVGHKLSPQQPVLPVAAPQPVVPNPAVQPSPTA